MNDNLHQSVDMNDAAIKATLEAIPGIAVLKDAETGKIVFCNEEYVRHLGKESKADVIGKTAEEIYKPENAAQFMEEDKEIITSEQPKVVFDEKMIMKNGKTIRLKTAKSRYVGSDGKVYILGISDDITDITDNLNRTREESAEIKRLYDQLDTFNRLTHVNRFIAYFHNNYKSVFDIESIDCSEDMREVFCFDNQDHSKTELDNWIGMIHPDDRENVIKAYSENFEKYSSSPSPDSQMEIDYRAKNSGLGYRWFRNTTELQQEPKTGCLKMLGVITDINDTKEMELRQEIVEAIGESTAGLYYVDLNADRFRIFKKPDYIPDKDVNIQLPYTKAMTTWIKNGIVEEDQEKMLISTSIDTIREKLKNSNIYSVVYRSKSTNERHYFEMHISRPIEAKDFTHVTISFFDCNETVIAEHEREELNKQLEQQNSELARFKTISEYFLNTYVSAYYVDLNDGSCIILRRTKELSENYPIESDYLSSVREYISRDVHPDDREEMLKVTDPEYIRNQLSDKNEFSVLMRDISDGKEKIYQFQAIRGEDKDHCAFGFIDVTETMEKEKEQKNTLKNALEKADQANRAKTSFLFNMSHDVRTPMNAITGYTAMAKKYVQQPEKVSDYLEKIEISGNQLLSLINQVLEMSRIESGKIVLSEDKANVIEKAQEMATISTADAGAKNLTFNMDIGNVKHENVLCDVSRMNQILINIIGNAVKYTPEGGKIEYFVEEKENPKQGWANYEFTIADNGIGMSPEYLEHIFDEFSRENSSTISHIQGTGLGMAIVKKLLDILGGTIDITSEKGKGTTVKISVPMKIDTDTEESKKGGVNPNEISVDGLRILLVEDNEMNREIARVILEDSGVSVEEVTDGDEVIDKLKEAGPDHFDLILMDIQMPRVNGYEATKLIRALPDKKLADIPIIAMTANAFEEDRKAAIDAGMNEHIAKPINIQTMKETLAKFIRK